MTRSSFQFTRASCVAVVLFRSEYPDSNSPTIGDTLVRAYSDYLATSHPVHDRPTHELIREVLGLKRIQREWYEDFRQLSDDDVDLAMKNYV